MGHEFVGTVEQAGTAITTLKPGDPVVSPFTISCGSCFYCASGVSSRCEESRLFGTALLDGAQAEYVRVPLADSTLVKAPPAVKDPKLYLLMADVFPTGFFAAENAFSNGRPEGDAAKPRGAKGDVVVVLGCGPVGLCAVVAALEYKPKALLAVDSVQSRLDKAEELGAEPWNYQTQGSELARRVEELTDGRGADAVIEVVGHSSALDTAFKLLRPWGIISSVGVHNGEIPWTGNQAYTKNLTIKMGRCPVRSMVHAAYWGFQALLTLFLAIFPRALQLLEKKQHLLEYVAFSSSPPPSQLTRQNFGCAHKGSGFWSIRLCHFQTLSRVTSCSTR